MNTDDLHDEDDTAERDALSDTRSAARDRWFRRFVASERGHQLADAWAVRTEASRAQRRRGAPPPPRFQ